MRAAATALLAVVVVAGCGGGDQKAARTAAHAPAPRTASPGNAPSDAAAIRDWSRSLNAGEYDRAASWFAKDAIVIQSRTIKLADHGGAVLFNRSLPCKADVTRIKDEGRTTLASFRLRRGPGGACKGTARVRFTIKHGRFTVWHQLPEPPPAPGTTA